MKLDLIAINKLTPPGLWDLAALSALITTLLSVIEARIGGAQMARFCERMLARQSRDLRIKARENLNMRIKAWVMQSPERIAFVRRVIGEAAIRRWRKNRLADYALTKHFGDWKRKFRGGFGEAPQEKSRKPAVKPTPHTYNWKPFALVKIVNVERFLYGRARPDPELEQSRAAYLKLWGVDIRYKNKSETPRNKRTAKPVNFTLDELAPEAAKGVLQGAKNQGKVKPKEASTIQPHSPPREPFEPEKSTMENVTVKLEHKPP